MRLAALAVSMLASTAAQALPPATLITESFPAQLIGVDPDGNVLGASGPDRMEASPDGSFRWWNARHIASAMQIASDGTVYIAGEGLYSLSSPLREEQVILASEDDGGPIDFVYDFALDASGIFWLAEKLLLFSYDENSGEAVAYDDGPITRVAVRPDGGVFYTRQSEPDEVLRLEAEGELPSVALDSAGLGAGQRFAGLGELAVGPEGNLYALGSDSHNVFRITPAGEKSVILDARGDGDGVAALGHSAVSSDGAGGFLVVAADSDAVFRVRPGQPPQLVLDGRGDGVHDLDEPVAAVVDSAGHTWVAGRRSRNLFRIDPTGNVREVAERTLLAPLYAPTAMVVDSDDVAHVGGANGVVIAVPPHGASVDVERGQGSPVEHMLIDGDGRLVVSGGDQVVRRSATGTWSVLIDRDGDGIAPYRMAGPVSEGPDGNLYTVDRSSDHWFRIRWDGLVESSSQCHELGTLSDVVMHSETMFTLSGSAGLCRIAGGNPPRLIAFDASLGSIALDESGGVAAVDYWGSQTLYLDAAERWTSLLTANGVGSGHRLRYPSDLAIGPDGSVYVSGQLSGNVFRVTPDGRIHVPLEGGDDDRGQALAPWRIAVAGDNTLYMVHDYDKLYRVNVPACRDLLDNDGDGRIDDSDPDCRWGGRESRYSCGLGPELALGLAGVRLLRRRRR